MSEAHSRASANRRTLFAAAAILVVGIVMLACIGAFVGVSLVAIDAVPWHHLF